MASTRTLIWIAGLAGLVAGISLNTHRRREGERRTSSAKPQPLQAWEGEGGAVPLRSGQTAQQVSPLQAQQWAVDSPQDPTAELSAESGAEARGRQGPVH